MRLRLLLLAVSALALVVPATATAAERMYVGFQDEQSFRWAPDKVLAFDRAAEAGASVVRVTAQWNLAAPRRPADARSSFDPAYRLEDIDDAVRLAQRRGMEVLVTISGTPRWANGGKSPNYAPTRMVDLTDFAYALAERYRGHHLQFPFVRFYSIWNEPNLGQFLAPQFDARGRSVAPALYARMYAAAYAGIKAGSPKAQVAIGETSPRGRDKPLRSARTQESHSPGRFAELVARANPRLRFDAWAHHPYPVDINGRPMQVVKWPNVTLSSMKRFEMSLDKWFRRKNIPVWITEYAHQTKPEERRGVTYATQASYAAQALTIARKDPRVGMFIWFMLRDRAGERWQSGLVRRTGALKPAFASFRNVARAVDVRNPIIRARAGVGTYVVALPVLELRAHLPQGSKVGVVYRIFDGTRRVGGAEPEAFIEREGWITFAVQFEPVRGRRYTMTVSVQDESGFDSRRTLQLIGT